jgi:hypothetical protein
MRIFKVFLLAVFVFLVFVGQALASTAYIERRLEQDQTVSMIAREELGDSLLYLADTLVVLHKDRDEELPKDDYTMRRLQVGTRVRIFFFGAESDRLSETEDTIVEVPELSKVFLTAKVKKIEVPVSTSGKIETPIAQVERQTSNDESVMAMAGVFAPVSVIVGSTPEPLYKETPNDFLDLRTTTINPSGFSKPTIRYLVGVSLVFLPCLGFAFIFHQRRSRGRPHDLGRLHPTYHRPVESSPPSEPSSVLPVSSDLDNFPSEKRP